MRRIIVTSVMALLAEGALARPDLAHLLPKEGGSFEVVTPHIPEDVAEITERMAQGMQANAAWLEAQAKAGRTGTVPYDERLGVTRKEYEKALDAFEKMQFRKEIDVAIKVERQGSRLLISSSDPVLGAAFQSPGLAFDLNAKSVVVNGRQLASPAYDDGKSLATKIGRWVPGYTWQAPGVQLTVGQIEREPGKCLLNVLASGSKGFTFAMLRYPCGAR